jgi:glyoxylase-like metal-dependent hydrolase (beta-lactamase superfamily II)
MMIRANAWTEIEGGVRVRQSAAYAMNSGLLLAPEQTVVIDPGVLPSEIDELAQVITETKTERVALFFTHAHWDHVLGRSWWPNARTLGHDRLAQDVAKDVEKIRRESARLAEERGERWARAFEAFPIDEAMSGLRFFKLEPWGLVARDSPGHCPSSLTLHVPELRLLFAGDLLSDREIPGLDGPPAVYRKTLATLTPLIEGGAIETLVPGHGAIAQGHAQVRARLRADLDYLDRLEAGVRDARRAGLSLEDTRAKLSTMTITGRDDPEYPMGPIHEQNVTYAYRSSTTAVAAPRHRR